MELIAMNIAAEYMNIDNGYQLFRVNSGTYLQGLIERSVYNKRKRKLFSILENVRKSLARSFSESEEYFIVDPMPLEVCKNARANRSTICKEQEHCYPDKGYNASQNLHGVCAV